VIKAYTVLFVTAVWVPKMVIMVMHRILKILVSNMDHSPIFSAV